MGIKLFMPTLVIKIASKPKHRVSKTCKKISKKCLGVVVTDENGNYKVKVDLINNSKEFIIIDFTEESLNLRGKTHVFSTVLDENGKNICIIREESKAEMHPGSSLQYQVVRDGILISGYVVRKNDKTLFDYEQLISFSKYGYKINPFDESEDGVTLIE